MSAKQRRIARKLATSMPRNHRGQFMCRSIYDNLHADAKIIDNVFEAKIQLNDLMVKLEEINSIIDEIDKLISERW